MDGHRRTIRSYVIRAARLTPGQKRALDELYPVFGVDFPPPRQPGDLFPLCDRTVVEIGFGNGEATLELAKANPRTGYLGIEVHPPGVGHLLRAIQTEGLKNLRVLRHDAVEVVTTFADDTVDAFHVFFPDPWPKKKHHKRRLLNETFLGQLARVLKPGGEFYLATDWEEYAEEVLEILSRVPLLKNRYEHWAAAAAGRPSTRFERRGRLENRPIREVVFEKRGNP